MNAKLTVYLLLGSSGIFGAPTCFVNLGSWRKLLNLPLTPLGNDHAENRLTWRRFLRHVGVGSAVLLASLVAYFFFTFSKNPAASFDDVEMGLLTSTSAVSMLLMDARTSVLLNLARERMKLIAAEVDGTSAADLSR
jgi:hypothetical protein